MNGGALIFKDGGNQKMRESDYFCRKFLSDCLNLIHVMFK